MGKAGIQTLPSPAKSEIAEVWSGPLAKEIILCAATFLAYVSTLSFGFVYDDEAQIVKNSSIQAWTYLPRYFTSHVWAEIYPGGVGNYYRPLFLLWLRLNHAAWGLAPQWWHLTSILCHVAVTWLVFRLAWSLTEDRSTAFLAGLLFGLHPAHIESVAWVSGVTDSLMAIFFLASLGAYFRYRGNGRKRWLCAAIIAFALALLLKETALLLPLVIVVCEWPRKRSGNPSLPANARRSAIVLLFCLAVVAAYWLARNSALGGFVPQKSAIGWKNMLLAWPSVLLFYGKHLIWPFGLSEFYPSPVMAQISSREFVGSLLLLLLGAVCAGALVAWLRWSQSVRCAIALLVLPLLPALYFPALTPGDILHDRYLYLPSAGFAILLAVVLERLASTRPRGKIVHWAVGGILVIAYSVGTVRQQFQWLNERRLYTKGLQSAPDNNLVRDNLAGTFLDSGEYDQAFLLLMEVLRRDPNYWRSNYNLGFLYYKTGHYAEAEQYFTRAIKINPADGDEFANLGLVQVHQGRLDEALANTRRAIQLKPRGWGYHYLLGILLNEKGLRSDAAQEFRLELMYNPGHVSAAQALRAIEQEN